MFRKEQVVILSDYLQGKGRFMPYIRHVHAKEYGGPRDYYNCTSRYYVITFKPSPVDIQAVTKSKFMCSLNRNIETFVKAG